MYVGNVCYTTTEDSIKDLFSSYGEVLSVDIIKDKITGKSKGFAFVQMSQDQEADNAIKSLDGYELDGRKIRVNEARERSSRDRNFSRERRGFSPNRFKKFRNQEE